MGTCYAELKRALDDSVRLINEIVAFVCNTMVTENAVAYVTVSESDANAQKLVSKAVQVLSQPVNPQVCTMCLLSLGRCGAPGPQPLRLHAISPEIPQTYQGQSVRLFSRRQGPGTSVVGVCALCCTFSGCESM